MIHKLGVAIITTIILGAITFAGSSIINHNDRIIRLEEREKTNKEILLEVKNHVEYIRRKLE